MKPALSLAAILLLCAHAAARAQSPCLPTGISVEGAPFHEAWVDISQGNDVTGVIANPGGAPSVAQAKAAPFRTIQAAIDAVANVVNLPDNPGLVHLQPGTYDPSTQPFPIRMKNGVNVQGVSARECVLRKGAATTVFLPVGCDCGITASARVLVDFSFSAGGPVYSEAIDGVTFQGGHIQVYVDMPFIKGRISNCLFDMVDYGPALRGPEFGILMVHEFHPTPPDYREINMDVFNNTFVMGWVPNGYGGTVFTCSPTAVGICDVNNPLCGDPGGEDPDRELRGIGYSNIQNNLFRELEGSGSSTAFMGVAYEDTAMQDFTPTNIFLNFSENNGLYCVRLRYDANFGPPASPGYDDPAHVGEMLTNFLGLNMLNVGRDWRILPESIAVDAGVAPTNGTMAALNGQVYVEPSTFHGDCRFSAIDSFDFDGEGYGNRRIVGGYIDVGFDEFELMIDSGLGNESLSIPATANPCSGVPGDPCYCAPFAGAGVHRLIVKGGGSLSLRIKSENCPTGSYTIQPGSMLPPAPLGSSFAWFNGPYTLTAPLTPTVYTTYVPPDSSVAHKFGIVTRSSTNNGKFRLFQGQYGGVWSNLQATVD